MVPDVLVLIVIMTLRVQCVSGLKVKSEATVVSPRRLQPKKDVVATAQMAVWKLESKFRPERKRYSCSVDMGGRMGRLN